MAAMMRQKRKQILTITDLIRAVLCALALMSPMAVHGASLVQTIVTDPLSGVAIDGYDAVSYFTEPEPLPGVSDYEYVWQGVPWYFASAANRDVFMRNPDIYAPQFGGHCVTSLSRGFLSDGKPRLYAIEKMKLYLFYSLANREAFLATTGITTTAANAAWFELMPGLTSEEPSFADAVAERDGSSAEAKPAGH